MWHAKNDPNWEKFQKEWEEKMEREMTVDKPKEEKKS
tara:strand:+ start:56 stop:166 length:111 start_codon:yes stop_codon:yes gene_type:complete